MAFCVEMEVGLRPTYISTQKAKRMLPHCHNGPFIILVILKSATLTRKLPEDDLSRDRNMLERFKCFNINVIGYYPRHVSSIDMPIFRRKSCIHRASGIVALCNRYTVQPVTESDDTRCCVNTTFPPEDGHVNARNMSRIIV